jgi:DNA-binding MarR family transcriptional regulator
VQTDYGGVFDERPTGLLLRLAHQHARAAANQALRPLDLDLRHVGVLAALAGGGPQTQKQLAEAVELDKSSMVYVIDRLERLNLVRRERSRTDRRAYAVSLTDQGRERLTDAGRVAVRVMGELLESFDVAEERQLNAMLQRIIDRARQLRQG